MFGAFTKGHGRTRTDVNDTDGKKWQFWPAVRPSKAASKKFWSFFFFFFGRTNQPIGRPNNLKVLRMAEKIPDIPFFKYRITEWMSELFLSVREPSFKLGVRVICPSVCPSVRPKKKFGSLRQVVRTQQVVRNCSKTLRTDGRTSFRPLIPLVFTRFENYESQIFISHLQNV